VSDSRARTENCVARKCISRRKYSAGSQILIGASPKAPGELPKIAKRSFFAHRGQMEGEFRRKPSVLLKALS